MSVVEDLTEVERRADELLAAEGGALEADVEAAAAASDRDDGAAGDAEPERPAGRLCLAVALPTIAAGVMVGGIFQGASPRVYAGVAGVLGVLLALAASRLRSTVATYAVIVGGLFAIALAMVVPSGVANLASFGKLAQEAATSRGVLRPPAPWTPGWMFIVGGLLGFVGFAAAWVALVVKRPSIGLLCPLPLAAIAGISVPKVAQVPSGIACLALFAVGMGVLATATAATEESERPPLSYELRRAGKGIVFVVVISVALAGLAQADVLFPKPKIDPTTKPQKPRTVPLSEVPDRVLFTVKADFTLPYVIGVLDEYDGTDWRTPAFGANRIKDVPRSGVLSNDRVNELKADFAVAGLSGSILPTLPGTQGVVANGPRLSYDARSGNLRVTNGQVQPGLEYTVVSPNLPKVDDLRRDDGAVPADVARFADVPDAPPAVAALLRQASQVAPDKWDRFFYLFQYTLNEITLSGQGQPVAIPPSRVQEILGSDAKEASPFEVVALQALLARWLGVPSRIGFGYDKCAVNGDVQECRPKNGALFVEVYFPGAGWFPVTGQPKKAKPTVGSKPTEQQVDPNVQPSDDIAISLFLPVVTPPGSVVAQQVLLVIGILVPLLLLAWLGYVLSPLVTKARRRSRRRSAAAALGPRARIALAYCEWRDACTDQGYRHPGDPPLGFLERFSTDPEHAELAWATTRALWGDRQDDLTDADATACEELSRALRRRLAAAPPATGRFIAALSRLSVRHPYSPELDALLRDGAGPGPAPAPAPDRGAPTDQEVDDASRLQRA